VSDKLLHFQCLISGFDYELMKRSSIKSKKQALIYSNAILVIAIIWLGLGVGIGRLYGGDSALTPWLMGTICPLLIILIERIIVQTPNSKWTFAGRFFIGILISMVGSTLMTQVLFSKDIMVEKRTARRSEEVQIRKQRIQDLSQQNNRSAEASSNISAQGTVVDVFQTNPDGKIVSVGKRESGSRLREMKAQREAQQAREKQIAQYERELIDIDKIVDASIASAGNQRSLLDDLNAMGQIVSKPTPDGKKVLGVFNNQAGLFRQIFFLLILALELLVVSIKFASSKDKFDYQLYLEGSDLLGINIAKSKFDTQLDNFKTQGSRDLVDKLLKEKYK
jgi:hypothetical protein